MSLNTENAIKPTIPEINSTVLFISSFVVGLAFDLFFMNGYIGISYPISSTLFLIIYIVNAAVKERLKININCFFLIPVFILSFSFAVSDNFVLRTINFFLIPILFIFTLILINSSKEISWFKYTFIEVYFKKVIDVFDNISTIYANFFKDKKSSKPTGLAKKVLLGIGISLVLSVLIITLLVSADAVFLKIISDVFSFFPQLQIHDWLRHLLTIIIVSSIIGGLFYAVIYVKNSQKESESIIKKEADIITISIVLFVLIALYILFGVIQFIYLFGGESNITSTGITYSSYAVRGFWELVAVAFINLMVILTSLHITKSKTKSSEIFLKILLIFINLLTFVLIFSAHKRLFLYEEMYGYTQARIYAHLAILFLFILYVFVAYKIINIKFYFTKAVILIWLVLYSGLNLINSDEIIAKQNISRFKNSEKIDIYYLVNELSADAIPQIVEFRKTADNELKGEIDKYLKPKYEKVYKNIGVEPWFSYNFSRIKAKELLDDIDQNNEWVEPKKYDALSGPQFSSFPKDTTLEIKILELRDFVREITRKEPNSQVFAQINLNKKLSISEFANIVEQYAFTNINDNSSFVNPVVHVCSEITDRCGFIGIRNAQLTENGLKKVIAEDAMIGSFSLWTTTQNLQNFWNEPDSPVQYIEVHGKGPERINQNKYK